MGYQIDYKSFYEDSPDMLFSVEAKTGNIIECNGTLLSVLGYTKNEFLGKNIIDMYHPDSRDRAKENLSSFQATGDLIYSEFEVIKKDGEVIDVTLKLTPVYDDNGNLMYSNAAWRDVCAFHSIHNNTVCVGARTQGTESKTSGQYRATHSHISCGGPDLIKYL